MFSGNILLDSLSPKKLNKKEICHNHFDKEMFMNPLCPVKLKPFAVPRKFIETSKLSDI